MKTFINNSIELIKKNLFIIVAFVTYIIFYTFFEHFISNKLVNTFFSQVHSSHLNDIIFSILFIIIIVKSFVYIIKNYSISNRYLLISFLLFLLFGYYRIKAIPWDFTPTYFLPAIKYIDIVLLFLFTNIIIKLFHRKKTYETEEGKGFCFDNPINYQKDDLLNRNKFAKLLTEKIVNTTNDNDSFTVGVSSEWGYGKTSFLNLIHQNLLEIKGKRIIINFNPWLNNDEKSIVYSFFDELSSKLRMFNRELSKEISKYANLLNSIQPNIFKNLDEEILSLGKTKEDNLPEYYNTINKAIKESGYQIVIFIDDLDRLYENEVLEVLRLIRNSANFSNTVFIVAYDRNYLISALKKANEYHPDLYLEKFFQIEIPLPEYEDFIIANKLIELVGAYISNIDHQTEIKGLIEASLSKHSLNGFFGNYFQINKLSNLRDVYRFFNSFLMSYEALKGEVSLLDLLNIELLRIKYLGVYNLLAQSYNDFLNPYTYQATKHFLSLEKIKDDKGIDTDKTKLEKYLEDKYIEVGINKNQIQDAIKFVYGVFPHYQYIHDLKEDILSIAYPSSIRRYFHYSLLNSDLSEIEFSKARKNLNKKDFKEEIKKWVENKLHNDVQKRLEDIELFDNKEDYEKIIESIFYYSSIEHPVEKNRELGFDKYNLYLKFNFDKVTSFYTSKFEYKNYLIDLFKNQSEPYYFISNFIDEVFEISSNEWPFILEEKDLLKLKIYYFKKYSEKIELFDRAVFHLFYYCRYKSGQETKYQPEAKQIFISCANRIPASFIKNIIAKNNDTYLVYENKPIKYSVLKNTIIDVWDNWEAFEAFIQSLKGKRIQGLDEFETFYNQCKEKSYNYIEFHFDKIDLSSDAVLFSNS